MRLGSIALFLMLAASSRANTQILPVQSPESPARSGYFDTSGPMTREKFTRYVATFNAGDLRFVEFYKPDIEFDKGPVEGKLVGRAAIASWYRSIWQDVDETITPLSAAIDIDGKVMLVELRTQLEATRDNVKRPTAILNRGDRYVVDGTIVYGIEDGLIASIRGASKAVTITRADGTVEKL